MKLASNTSARTTSYYLENVSKTSPIEEFTSAEMGYHPHFYYKPKKDCWTLGLGIREEAFRVLQLLPFHHNEKQRKLKLVLEIKNAKYWSEVSKRVMILRKQIEEEVRLCVSGAFEDYRRLHKEEILPQPPKYIL